MDKLLGKGTFASVYMAALEKPQVPVGAAAASDLEAVDDNKDLQQDV